MKHTPIATHNLAPAVQLGLAPSLAASAVVSNSRFGRSTQVGEQTRMENCLLDDCSDIQQNGELASTDTGKFSNFAAMVRINPGFHPMEYPTHAPCYLPPHDVRHGH